jgi:metal-sulfur cluster biosynthetic enzyme
MPPAALVAALRDVVDPELGVNIVDLGLVYGLAVQDGAVQVVMTMTSPACPLGTFLADLIDTTVRARVPEARSVEIALVWDPPWGPEMMSDEARRQLDEGWGGDLS